MPKTAKKKQKPSKVIIGSWGLILVIAVGLLAGIIIYAYINSMVDTMTNSNSFTFPTKKTEEVKEPAEPVNNNNHEAGKIIEEVKSETNSYNNNDTQKPVAPR